MNAFRARFQSGLVVLAIAGTLLSTAAGQVPSAAEYFVLIACAGAVAVCARFPLLTDRTELSLAHVIGLGIMYTAGGPAAAWTLLIGLLVGEAWWFVAPGSALTPQRPARLSRLASQIPLHLLPLLAAGALDGFFLQTFAVNVQARHALPLSLVGLVYLSLYTGLQAWDVTGAPGARTSFFRTNLNSIVLVGALPLLLTVWLVLDPDHLGAGLLLTIAAAAAYVSLYLHRTSGQFLLHRHLIAETGLQLEQTRLRAEQSSRQLTLATAKLELAQHEIAAHQRRVQAAEALTQLEGLLRDADPSRPPYDASLRLLCDLLGAAIGQFGLIVRGGTAFNYVASHGLSADRAQHERATIWLQEQGLAGRALRLNRAVRVGQVAADPDYTEHFQGIRSELCVPLSLGERRLGVLRFLSRQTEAFSAEQEAVALQAAGLISWALENIQLAEEARTHQKENAVLLDTGVKIAATLDIRTVYRAIVQKLAEAVGADTSTLYELDPSRAALRLAEPRGTGTYALTDLPGDERAITSGQVVILRADAPTLTSLETTLLADHSAVAIVPMAINNQVIGVVHLYLRQRREFSVSDLHIAQMLANQSAVALQNARLFHNVTEGRDRLAAILDSTREGVLVIDASGMISLINPPLEEFWGIPSHQLLDQHLLTLVDQPELKITEKIGLQRDEIEELLLTLRAGLALSIPKQQFPVYTPRQRFLERTGAPVLDQFAKAIGWVVILRDITEERELQHVRDTLANMIVHDLRSPLTSMLAGASLIRDRLPKEHQSPLIKQSIDVAIRSGNKMLGLVNTLLDIARMESGEITLNRQPQRLEQIVEEVLGELTPLANDQGLVLINDVPADLPPVEVDREKLSRVFTNLLDNALKFSPPGGQVMVRAVTGAGSAEIICSIWDSGPGIPTEYLLRIFDRFVQVEGQTGRRTGTGLGLAFCKLTVEAHGGRIWVENRPEGGSAFSFALPAGR